LISKVQKNREAEEEKGVEEVKEVKEVEELEEEEIYGWAGWDEVSGLRGWRDLKFEIGNFRGEESDCVKSKSGPFKKRKGPAPGNSKACPPATFQKTKGSGTRKFRG
jgi:hypothetical protein